MQQANVGKDVHLFTNRMTNSATTTANVDVKGADYAVIRLFFDAELNTNAVGPTISLLESDDTVATNFATIVANRTNEDLTSERAVRYNVDCKTRKRYLRLSVTTGTSTNDDITVSAFAELHRLESMPSGTTGMVNNTSNYVVVEV